MNEYIITENELNAFARYLESRPLGESMELYLALKNIEDTRQVETAKQE